MPNPSHEKQEIAATLKKNATIWAIVIGLFTAALVFWILEQRTGGVRIGAALLGGVVVAIAKYRKTMKAGAEGGDDTE